MGRDRWEFALGQLLSFVCECGDDDCGRTISLTRDEYEFVRATSNRFAIALNHENPEAEVVVSECERFAVVDKIEGWGFASRARPIPLEFGLAAQDAGMSDRVTATCDADGTWLVSLHGDHDLATRARSSVRRTRSGPSARPR